MGYDVGAVMNTIFDVEDSESQSDAEPDLELDLWEGQFEFVGPQHPSALPPMSPTSLNLPVPNQPPNGNNGVSKSSAHIWVDDISEQVQMLQQQVSALADTQNNTDDRYGRMRQENAMLQARVMILEEQLREEQVRTEERLQDETRRHREIMTRVEREKQLELENGVIRLQAVERKASSLEDEVTRLRAQTERQALARHRAEETIGELEAQLHSLRTEHAELQEHSHLRLEVESLRARTSSIERGTPSPAGGRGAELEAEVRALREESRGLREALEEAQAQLLSQGLEQGRTLLGEQPVLGLVGTSLADELEEMSSDKVRLALREQQEVNMQLRAYIDGILLNIVENYPQLLEVKSKNNK
ncbi:hypothetical protein B566_EDAN010970 [Ephemera danica]|nr:hypothetical protein B566_EDAN010970 [Ephemera danica]